MTETLSFEKQPEEYVINTRRHWINLVWRALVPGTLTVLLWLGAIAAFVSSLDLARDWGVAAALVLLVLSLFPALWTAGFIYDWSNDYMTISREQIVHYEQYYFFSHSTHTAPLRQVQNVGIYIPNAIFRWLNVGHVFIDTAGQEGAIRFKTVEDPRGIQSTIFELLGRPVPTELAGVPSSRFEKFLPIYPIQTVRGGLIWHRHWWVLIKRIALPLLLSLGLLVLLTLWLLEGLHVGFATLPEMGVSVAVFLVLAWIVVSLLTLYVYEDWKNDYWIVTDTHIIDVDALPFISEDRRQARLEDIQDVRTDVPSPWARIINMGNVFAETAGRAQSFVFEEVWDPNSIQDEIFQRRAIARARAQQEEEQAKLVEQKEFEQHIIEIVLERMGHKPVPPEPQPGSE